MYDPEKWITGSLVQNNIIKWDHGIKAKCATMENPKSNSILERIHQVIANLVRTYDLQNINLVEDDPWSDILAATSFAAQSMYNTTLQATPD